jgi:hypothetical protein
LTVEEMAAVFSFAGMLFADRAPGRARRGVLEIALKLASSPDCRLTLPYLCPRSSRAMGLVEGHVSKYDT